MKTAKGKRHVKPAKLPAPPVDLLPVEPEQPSVPSASLAQRIRRPAWCLFSALLITFYLWTATSGNQPFRPRDTSREFYNQLTTAFLKGHTYLDEKPAPQLLAMRDPYIPALNEPFRLNDASLYQGRYYLYFGAAPAIAFYLPWRVLTGQALSDDVAATLFGFGGYVFCCLLLFLLLKAAAIRPPWWVQAAAVLALALGQYAPIALRRPRIYEVAVSSAYCFLSAALYFLARRILNREERPDSGRWPLVVSGLCLGLAAGSRPGCAVAAVTLTAIYGFHAFRVPGLRGAQWLREFTPLFAPVAAAGIAICAYNFARFGDPLNFGIRYQLSTISYFHGFAPLPLQLRQIFVSLYYLLLCPPNFYPRFPFVELNGAAEPFGHPEWYPEGFYHEPAAGLLAMAPLCLAAVALPLGLWKLDRFVPPVRTVLIGLFACAVTMFGVVCTIPGASGRYGLDFAPALLVTGLFLCLSQTGNAIRAVTVAACLWAAVVNVGASINSYGYSLEHAPNTQFHTIATFFGSGPDAFTQAIDTLHFETNVTFPHAAPDTKEALLSTGIFQLWDLLFVQYVPGEKAMFGWVHSGVSDNWGPWVPIKPGTPQHLTADYSNASKRVTVRLDGSIVMDFPGAFFPTSRHRIEIGKIRVGRFGIHEFSGKLQSTQLQFIPLH